MGRQGCPTPATPQETSGGKDLTGKTALLSPVEVTRLCSTPVAAAYQTSPTRWRWQFPPGHHPGKQKEEGGQMGRARAETLRPRTDLLAAGSPPAARHSKEPNPTRGPLASSPACPQCALLQQLCLLHTRVPYLEYG